jgi:D-alanyl-D-alanine dipeptidase
MEVMLLLSDPIVAAVPARDCGEEFLDVHEHPELALDQRKHDPAGHWARLREGVLTRLLRAQHALPGGLRLLIIEGYRPAALQQRYFDFHRAELARAHPGWPDQQLQAEASKHIAPPAVAPHPCGAAVDLTLSDDDGTELDLGTPVNATPQASASACFTTAKNISDTARANRDILDTALLEAGLVNYPPEWWHYSYGDRYWAAATGAPAAIYTPR